MKGNKKLMILLIIALVLVAGVIAMVWHLTHYVIVDMKSYPKNAEQLDLREEEISAEHYESIHKKLPGTEILWNVPFQDGTYSSDSTKLTVKSFSDADLQAVRYFSQLKTVDADGCTDYARLLELQEMYPQLQVNYTVSISGRSYDKDADTVNVDGLAAEEVSLLQYLPELKNVSILTDEDPENLELLCQTCRDSGIPYTLRLAGDDYAGSSDALELEGVVREDISLLRYLPELKKIHFVEPAAEAEHLLQFAQDNPEIKVTWEKELFGVTVNNDTTELDLTEALSGKPAAYTEKEIAMMEGEVPPIPYHKVIKDNEPLPDKTNSTDEIIAEVEETLSYFPDVKTVIVGGVLLDNEAMSSFRESHREDYKVVWTVKTGKLATRTDCTFFMPLKYRLYYFLDSDCENLKYCEDLVCVDLGHMNIHHIEWVKYMPKLKYLVIAHTEVRTIEPISSCENLIFLEMDTSTIKDFTPIGSLKNLEDLNIGRTFGKADVVFEMTWLKNLWVVDRGALAYQLQQSMPETVNIMSYGGETVGNGWRKLPNYYAMRDELYMYYMNQ